jgi:hypothetical protein
MGMSWLKGIDSWDDASAAAGMPSIIVSISFWRASDRKLYTLGCARQIRAPPGVSSIGPQNRSSAGLRHSAHSNAAPAVRVRTPAVIAATRAFGHPASGSRRGAA